MAGDSGRLYKIFCLFISRKKKIKKSYCIVGACAGVRRERDPQLSKSGVRASVRELCVSS